MENNLTSNVNENLQLKQNEIKKKENLNESKEISNNDQKTEEDDFRDTRESLGAPSVLSELGNIDVEEEDSASQIDSSSNRDSSERDAVLSISLSNKNKKQNESPLKSEEDQSNYEDIEEYDTSFIKESVALKINQDDNVKEKLIQNLVDESISNVQEKRNKNDDDDDYEDYEDDLSIEESDADEHNKEFIKKGKESKQSHNRFEKKIVTKNKTLTPINKNAQFFEHDSDRLNDNELDQKNQYANLNEKSILASNQTKKMETKLNKGSNSDRWDHDKFEKTNISYNKLVKKNNQKQTQEHKKMNSIKLENQQKNSRESTKNTINTEFDAQNSKTDNKQSRNELLKSNKSDQVLNESEVVQSKLDSSQRGLSLNEYLQKEQQTLEHSSDNLKNTTNENLNNNNNNNINLNSVNKYLNKNVNNRNNPKTADFKRTLGFNANKQNQVNKGRNQLGLSDSNNLKNRLDFSTRVPTILDDSILNGNLDLILTQQTTQNRKNNNNNNNNSFNTGQKLERRNSYENKKTAENQRFNLKITADCNSTQRQVSISSQNHHQKLKDNRFQSNNSSQFQKSFENNKQKEQNIEFISKNAIDYNKLSDYNYYNSNLISDDEKNTTINQYHYRKQNAETPTDYKNSIKTQDITQASFNFKSNKFQEYVDFSMQNFNSNLQDDNPSTFNSHTKSQPFNHKTYNNKTLNQPSKIIYNQLDESILQQQIDHTKQYNTSHYSSNNTFNKSAFNKSYNNCGNNEYYQHNFNNNNQIFQAANSVLSKAQQQGRQINRGSNHQHYTSVPNEYYSNQQIFSSSTSFNNTTSLNRNTNNNQNNYQ